MSFLDFFRVKSNRVGEYTPETVIIIPAYNEQGYIERTIDLIRETKLDVHIVVVNNGSTDKTSEIAKAKGVEVIDQPRIVIKGQEQNLGKASAFFAGLKAALKKDPKVIITLDADMLTVPKDALLRLINSTARCSNARKSQMFVAKVYEEDAFSTLECPKELVGIRAFSIPAVLKLLSSRFKSLPNRFALETFLNEYFVDETTLVDKAIFLADHENRKKDLDSKYVAKERQKKEISDFKQRLADRKIRKFRLFDKFRKHNSPLRAKMR